jgi:hypothetical protein
MNYHLDKLETESILGLGGIYESVWVYVGVFKQIYICINTDTDGEVLVYQSRKGDYIDKTSRYLITGELIFEKYIDIGLEWIKIGYNNTDTQTYFKLRVTGLNHTPFVKLENQVVRNANLDVFENFPIVQRTALCQYSFANCPDSFGNVLPSTGYDDLFLESDSTDPSNHNVITIDDNVLWLGIKTFTGTCNYLRIYSSFNVPYRPGVCMSAIFTGAYHQSGDDDFYSGIGAVLPTQQFPRCGCFVGFDRDTDDQAIIYFVAGIRYTIPRNLWYWNESYMDYSKFQIYKIDCGYLGFYGYKISILDPVSREFKLLYHVSFLNSATRTFLEITSLGFIMQIDRSNMLGNTAKCVGVGSVNISINGNLGNKYYSDLISPISPLLSFGANTEHVALVIKSKATYLGKSNLTIWNLLSGHIYMSSTKPILVRFYRSVYSYAFTTFTDVNTNFSTLEYSLNPTSLALPVGMRLFETTILENGGKSRDISFEDFQLPSNFCVIMTIYSTGNISDILFTLSCGDFHA